jgi:proteasome-associated ATPase
MRHQRIRIDRQCTRHLNRIGQFQAVFTAQARRALGDVAGVDGDGSGFIYVKAAEVLNRFVGASEAAIRGLFARARAHKEKTGNPAVIFIDEADALLGSREGHGLTMAITQTVVPMFLAEMDGLEDSGAFVILSTNRPDSLDPAILRDGRMDVHVHIDRPDIESTNKIFARALRGRKLMASSQDDLVANAVRMLHSDSASLYELHFQSGGTELVRLRDGLSGAMIAGIVKAAAGAAIRRDRVSGEITGITGDDIEQAIRGKYNQFLSAKRSDLIQEKCDALGGARPIRIEKRPGRLD